MEKKIDKLTIYSYNTVFADPDNMQHYPCVFDESKVRDPDHDVDIKMGCRSVMMNKPCMPMGGVEFMGMVDNINKGDQPDRATVSDKPVVSDGSVWTCPLCGTANTGRFCCECGGARPQL